jgi:hypothetical protein
MTKSSYECHCKRAFGLVIRCDILCQVECDDYSANSLSEGEPLGE